jgi:hypothetical protein
VPSLLPLLLFLLVVSLLLLPGGHGVAFIVGLALLVGGLSGSGNANRALVGICSLLLLGCCRLWHLRRLLARPKALTRDNGFRGT